MIVPRAPLAAAAANAKLLARRSTLAILSHVMVVAKPENAWVTLTANDLVAQLSLDVECDIDEEIGFCVDAEKFARALSVEGDTVELKMDGADLRMKVGRSKFKFPTLPVTDFPVMKADSNKVASINAEWLPDALDRLAPFISSAGFEPRAFCRGVVVQVDGAESKLFGTNGHKMSRFVSADGAEGKCHKIVPLKSAQVAASLGCERLVLRDTCAVFLGENVQIVSSLVDGAMPDTSKFFEIGKFSFTAKRAALIEAVEVARALNDNQKVRGVRLVKSAEGVTVTLASMGGDGDISADAEGDNVDVGFDSEYLLDLLRIGKAEDVKVEWDSAEALCVRDGGYIAVAAGFRL